MNIHEHQAKEILKEFGAPVSNGTVVLSLDEIDQKISKLKKLGAFKHYDNWQCMDTIRDKILLEELVKKNIF